MYNVVLTFFSTSCTADHNEVCHVQLPIECTKTGFTNLHNFLRASLCSIWPNLKVFIVTKILYSLLFIVDQVEIESDFLDYDSVELLDEDFNDIVVINRLSDSAADKIIFTIFMANVGLTSFLIGYTPNYFYLWHTFVRVKVTLLCIINIYTQFVVKKKNTNVELTPSCDIFVQICKICH